MLSDVVVSGRLPYEAPVNVAFTRICTMTVCVHVMSKLSIFKPTPTAPVFLFTLTSGNQRVEPVPEYVPYVELILEIGLYCPNRENCRPAI